MASSGQILSIKVPHYLKEYFIHRFGNEPIKADNKSKLLILIAPFLEKIPANWRPPVSSDNSILVELPYSRHINVRTYFYINPRNQPAIKTLLYHLFCLDLVSYVNNRIINEHGKIKDALYDFMDERGINIEKTDIMTMIKIYYRYRLSNPCNQEGGYRHYFITDQSTRKERTFYETIR